MGRAFAAALLLALVGCAGSTEDDVGRPPGSGGASSGGAGSGGSKGTADGGPWPDGGNSGGGAGLGGAAAGGSGGTGGGAGGSGGGCVASAETCNNLDDDCNGKCDDGAGCRHGVYRSVSAATGEHFYTTSASEAVCCGFTLEASNFYYLYSASQSGLSAFYRCLSSNGKHFYTKSASCEGAGTQEGILGYAADQATCGAVPLYRLNKSSIGDHFYTTSATERDSAVAQSGYQYEGIAAYVWKDG